MTRTTASDLNRRFYADVAEVSEATDIALAKRMHVSVDSLPIEVFDVKKIVLVRHKDGRITKKELWYSNRVPRQLTTGAKAPVEAKCPYCGGYVNLCDDGTLPTHTKYIAEAEEFSATEYCIVPPS